MRINPQDKMISKNRMEKWVLRKAFEEYLPESFGDKKNNFQMGLSQLIDKLKELVDNEISDEQMKNAKYRFPIQTPQNKENFITENF